MLVLHGMLGSSRNWQTTGRDLAQYYHVFALDARNHGKSPHDPVMTYEAMMEDLIAWMDAQGITKAVMAGHSMGGKTAMLLACRHPERVERLVGVEIAPKTYQTATRKDFPDARIEVIADSGHHPHMDKREEFVRLIMSSTA